VPHRRAVQSAGRARARALCRVAPRHPRRPGPRLPKATRAPRRIEVRPRHALRRRSRWTSRPCTPPARRSVRALLLCTRAYQGRLRTAARFPDPFTAKQRESPIKTACALLARARTEPRRPPLPLAIGGRTASSPSGPYYRCFRPANLPRGYPR
jgi:hypothetical protein